MFVPPSKIDYNPYKLPDRINFLKATKDLPLPRGTKSKFQLHISKMNKEKLRETIAELESMLNQKLTSARVKMEKGHIIIPKDIVEVERRKILQEAIYTKAVKDFAEKYLISLEYQRKI